MKKLVLSALMLFIGINLFAQSAPAGGKIIPEGTITYTVAWTLPEQLQAMSGNFPTELKVFFKGDSSSLKTESPMYNSTSIMNVAKEYERLLLDIPMMRKKFSVVFSPADQEKMQANMPELTLKAETETKMIGGYNATKYSVNEKKTGQNSDAWFTKDLQVTPNTLTRYFDKSYGFPVEFTSYMNGLSVKATLKELKPGAVPAGSFSAPKGYEEITLEQLMQMQGGGR
jgi:GLPGLI family protein